MTDLVASRLPATSIDDHVRVCEPVAETLATVPEAAAEPSIDQRVPAMPEPGDASDGVSVIEAGAV